MTALAWRCCDRRAPPPTTRWPGPGRGRARRGSRRSAGTRSPAASMPGPTVTVASSGSGATASRMFCSICRCPAKALVLKLTRTRGTGLGTAALGTPCHTTPVWQTRRRSTRRVEISAGGDDLQEASVFGHQRVDTTKPQPPADRARRQVLNRAIEAVHEDDRGQACVHDLRDPGGQDHVDDDCVGMVAPGGVYHGTAEPSVRGHSGEIGHDGGQRTSGGRVEMSSLGKGFERATGGLHAVAYSAMSDDVDLDAAGLKSPRRPPAVAECFRRRPPRRTRSSWRLQ